MQKRVIIVSLFLIMGFGLLVPVTAGSVTTNIRVAVNVNMPPYQFLDNSEKCVGIHIDMLDSIAKRQNLQVEYIQFRNDADTLIALETGDADAVLGAKAQFPAKYAFRQAGELSSSSLCSVASDEIAKEIVINGFPYYYYTIATDYLMHLVMGWASLDQSDLGMTMRRITSNPQATFALLMDKKVQVAIMDKETIVYDLKQAHCSDDYTILNNYLMTISYTILVRENDRILQRALETGLSDLRLHGEYQIIRSKWIEETKSDNFKRIAQVAGTVLAFAAAIIIINLYINYMLKRKVAKKTKELLHVNEELSQSMTQLEREQIIRNGLIENSPSGMVMFDINFTIRLINRRAQMLADYVADAEVGGNVRGVKIFGEILNRLNCDIFSAAWQGMNSPQLVKINDGGNQRGYRYTFYSPLAHDEGRNVLMVVEDVTIEEKHRQELQEEEKNKSLNTLIAGISHEIKNPLMAIQTYISTLSWQINNPDYLASLEKNIPQEVRRINRLVDALINYARPVKSEMERFDFSAVVNDSLFISRASITSKQIVIDAQLGDGIYVFANKDKIKQTIINIVANGIESMGAKLQNLNNTTDTLHIVIWTERRDKQVLLHIRDEGSGMTGAEIRRCTEPFFTTKTTGTGLGMSLAKQYVKDNNGVMTIESEEGQYTMITLAFWEVD